MVKFNGLWCHNSFCNWKFYKGIVLQSFILMKAQLKHSQSKKCHGLEKIEKIKDSAFVLAWNVNC